MKRLVVILVIALILGGLLGSLMVKDPGYVLLAYNNWSMETSLWLFLVLLLAIYFLLRLIVFSIGKLVRGQHRLGEWNRHRKSNFARKQMISGLLLMSEGKWQAAQRQLLKEVDHSETPLINYLAAARAADEQGLLDQRDDLLGKAHESTAGSRLAVGLTQAELQLHKQQWEQALATLLSLREEVPDHPQVLKYLQQCYVVLNDWQALSDLLPILRKNKVISPSELQGLEQKVFLNSVRDQKKPIQQLWRKLPKEFRTDEGFVKQVAETLMNEGSNKEFVETVLREFLSKQWSEELVRLYGKLNGADSERQMVTAEKWLKERPNSAALLLTLGRLAMRLQSWAKAREYYEASLRIARSKEAYGELGRLCLALGDSERGAKYLSKACESEGLLPDIPLPNS